MTMHDAYFSSKRCNPSFQAISTHAGKPDVFPRNLPLKKGRWLGRELNPRHEDFQSSALPTELPSRSGKIRKSNVEGRSEFRTPGCHYGGFSFVGKGRSTDRRGEHPNEAMRSNVGRKRDVTSQMAGKRGLQLLPQGADSAVPSIRARPIRQPWSPAKLRGKSTAWFRRCR